MSEQREGLVRYAWHGAVAVVASIVVLLVIGWACQSVVRELVPTLADAPRAALGLLVLLHAFVVFAACVVVGTALNEGSSGGYL